MTNEQFLFTLFCTVFFCLGWRIVTDEGQLLYFLKKPFENLYDKIDNALSMYKNTTLKRFYYRYLRLKILFLFVKPFILCITCMGSIWGISVFVALNGLHKELIIPMILNCFCASFIQTFIWNIYDRISNG